MGFDKILAKAAFGHDGSRFNRETMLDVLVPAARDRLMRIPVPAPVVARMALAAVSGGGVAQALRVLP